ncbi:hypothetical protein AWB79_06187 [Caballeronia hypogeia]|uniref:Uncharacterized protein n=1 Tax=Caballeronia hypogeia TaxID=1777140 RepID=A0A158CZS8_9BURK|nr:hypothetical protein AWB79_06187 [Caballeronia hypogeia]
MNASRRASVVTQKVRCLIDLECAGDLDDFSRLNGLELSKLLAMYKQQIGQTKQDIRAFCRRSISPGTAECFEARQNRGIDVILCSISDARDDFTVRRADNIDARPFSADQMTVNVMTVLSLKESFDFWKQGNE